MRGSIKNTIRTYSRIVCLGAVLTGLLVVLPNSAEAGKYTRKNKYASIVMEADSGHILNEINADKKLYPASLTKMMTLYLTFDALKAGKLHKNTYIRASWRGVSQPPSTLGLKSGEAIRVENAILALVTKSANDVAVTLAEAIAGSEKAFAHKMTKKAQELGMSRTNFVNASGLHSRKQYSTAHDMAVLAKSLMNDHKEYYHYFKTPSFKYKGLTFKNHNALMKTYKGMDGLKTGYIRASGFNLASSVTRNGKRVIGVVFGGKTSRARNMIMAHLLDKGFTKLSKLNVRSLKQHEMAKRIPTKRPGADIEPVAMVASVGTMSGIEPASGADREDAFVSESLIDRIQRRFVSNFSLRQDQGDAAFDDSRDEASVEKNWVIQIGAFKNKFKSMQAIKEAKEDLGYLFNAKDSIAPLVTDRGVIYRARITGVSLNTARSACDVLENNCLILTAD